MACVPILARLAVSFGNASRWLMFLTQRSVIEPRGQMRRRILRLTRRNAAALARWEHWECVADFFHLQVGDQTLKMQEFFVRGKQLMGIKSTVRISHDSPRISLRITKTDAARPDRQKERKRRRVVLDTITIRADSRMTEVWLCMLFRIEHKRTMTL